MGSCKKYKSTVYTASYTINTTACPDNHGFKIKGSSSAISPSLRLEYRKDGTDVELYVILCNAITTSNLPQTIPAIIYKNGELYLTVDLIRLAPSNSSVNNRTYIYHFKHYKN